jgi:release factor glutamine methyltransferase
MKVEEALKSSGIDRLDAEVILASTMRKSREWLMAHPDDDVEISTFQRMVDRRKKNEPVSYIVENQEFYGRDFYVDNRVLIPRSSTERLVDLALDFLEDGEDRIRELDTKVVGVARKYGNLSDVRTLVDVCTGSGCIAITLALETDKKIIATDISNDALDVAKKNAQTHGVIDRIDFRLGDLIEPVSDVTDPYIVIANPPYVPEDDPLTPDVSDFEPTIALFAGPDGSKNVVKINNSLKGLESCKGCVIECRDSHLNFLA